MAKTAAKETVAEKPSPIKGATRSSGTKTVVKKPAQKVSTQPVTKTAAKVTAKVTTKAATKPATKTGVKITARPVATKATGKVVAKAVAKPVAKPITKKSAPKAAAKPVNKTATKPSAQPVTKVTAKVAPKATAKPVVKKAVAAQAKAPAKAPAKATIKAPAKIATRTPVAPARVKSSRNTPTAPAAPLRAATRIKPLDGSVLTEAQLLKMSEKDYMNAQQLGFFKALLLSMKDEILANAQETGEHLKENETFADPNDRATVEEENILEQRVRDRERKLLKKIDQSLARIEEGEYGYCKETGEPIGLPRLLARPTADLCIEAQEKHERREKQFAD